jgi:hypothetical protein
MLSARCTSLLALLAASGCLQPGKLPEGRKLFSGRDLGSLGFVSIDGIAWVAFNRRKAPATPSTGAVSDLWIAGPVDSASLSSDMAPGGASPDGIQQRLVIANRSDRWGAAQAGDSALTKSLFTMVDERQVTSGGAGGGQVESVGTLVRLDPHFQANVSFENVSTFTLDPQHDSRLLYRQVPTNGDVPGLFLWDGQDSRRLGDVANVSLLDMQVAGSGTAYFVLGTDRVLSRLDKLTDTVQDLHPNVSRFLLRGDEKYVALSLSTAGTNTTVVLDVQAGKDMPLARPNPGWLGFANPDLFTYSQSASAGAPAEYHTLDLVSGLDTTLVLPDPLVDYWTVVNRPQSDEVLYLDSQGHGVFLGPDQQVRRVVQRFGTDEPLRMLSPIFSRDGRYLIYLDPLPTTQAEPYRHGLLTVRDADLVTEPRQLSTPGMTVREGNYFFIDGPSTDAGASVILVFWANVVRSTSDLFFANHETGELKVVAGAIGSVSVDSQRIFGTVNESAQDAVGDLVVKDVRGCVQDKDCRVLARAVAEATQSPYWIESGNLVAYTVRGRVSSDHDGLWGTTLTPPGQDGGQ